MQMKERCHGEVFAQMCRSSSLPKQDPSRLETNKQPKEFCVQTKTDGRRSGRGVNLADAQRWKWDSGDLRKKKGSFRDGMVQHQRPSSWNMVKTSPAFSPLIGFSKKVEDCF